MVEERKKHCAYKHTDLVSQFNQIATQTEQQVAESWANGQWIKKFEDFTIKYLQFIFNKNKNGGSNVDENDSCSSIIINDLLQETQKIASQLDETRAASALPYMANLTFIKRQDFSRCDTSNALQMVERFKEVVATHKYRQLDLDTQFKKLIDFVDNIRKLSEFLLKSAGSGNPQGQSYANSTATTRATSGPSGTKTRQPTNVSTNGSNPSGNNSTRNRNSIDNSNPYGNNPSSMNRNRNSIDSSNPNNPTTRNRNSIDSSNPYGNNPSNKNRNSINSTDPFGSADPSFTADEFGSEDLTAGMDPFGYDPSETFGYDPPSKMENNVTYPFGYDPSKNFQTNNAYPPANNKAPNNKYQKPGFRQQQDPSKFPRSAPVPFGYDPSKTTNLANLENGTYPFGYDPSRNQTAIGADPFGYDPSNYMTSIMPTEYNPSTNFPTSTLGTLPDETNKLLVSLIGEVYQCKSFLAKIARSCEDDGLKKHSKKGKEPCKCHNQQPDQSCHTKNGKSTWTPMMVQGYGLSKAGQDPGANVPSITNFEKIRQLNLPGNNQIKPGCRPQDSRRRPGDQKEGCCKTSGSQRKNPY